MATRWGIFGTGGMANDFAAVLKGLPPAEHQITAVASRNLERAQEFAKKYDIPHAYGSYEELAQSSEIDIAHVAVIIVAHFDVCKLLLNAGKNVLCETPMTMCKKQAQELIDLAKKKNVFLMKALWSNFTPAYKFVRQQIKEGAIGEPKFVQCDFCINATIFDLERLLKKELGAGALIELGVYTINVAMLAFGEEYPEQIAVVGEVKEEGIDDLNVMSLKYSKGRVASLACSLFVDGSQNAFIYGTKGKIEIKLPFWTPTEVVVNETTHTFPTPETNFKLNYPNSNNLTFEIRAVRECLLKGLKECPEVSHDSTLKIHDMVDEARRQLGVPFVCDKV